MCRVLFGFLLAFFVTGISPVSARDCTRTYIVQPGESLSMIAQAQYDDAALWEKIHADNLDVIGEKPDAVRAGMTLRLGCAGDTLLTNTPMPQDAIKVLTASGFAPFSDRDLPNGGLMTELVDAVMTRAAPAGGHTIHWIEDRAAHLDPLLSNALMDMGFPWPRPEYETAPQTPLCRTVLFSDPVFEALVVLFTDASRPLPYSDESDIAGRRLCRPRGFPTDDLDRPDRRWISDRIIALIQPDSIDDCLSLVLEGQADAMVMDEFSGQSAVRRLNLTGRITALREHPLSIETLHVVVPRAHPQAQQLVDMVNTALHDMRESGTFHDILEAHLMRFWGEG